MTIIGCTNIVHRLIEWLSTVTVIFDCDDKFVDLSSTSRVMIDSEMSRAIVIVFINKLQ